MQVFALTEHLMRMNEVALKAGTRIMYGKVKDGYHQDNVVTYALGHNTQEIVLQWCLHQI